MKDRAQEEQIKQPSVKTSEIMEIVGRKMFGFENCPIAEQKRMIVRCAKAVQEYHADAIRRAEIRGCNQACDLFIEITEGDTNEIVARHSKIVANSIRQLKPGKE